MCRFFLSQLFSIFATYFMPVLRAQFASKGPVGTKSKRTCKLKKESERKREREITMLCGRSQRCDFMLRFTLQLSHCEVTAHPGN